jgi:hypothetical protein
MSRYGIEIKAAIFTGLILALLVAALWMSR